MSESQKKNPLRIEKVQVEVSVQMLDSSWVRGKLFLAAATQEHAGTERVSDIIDHREEQYFPVRSGDRFIMVHKPAVARIEIDKEQGLKEYDPYNVMNESTDYRPAVIHLITGDTVEGEALILPEGGRKIRLLDWLNNSPEYIHMLSCDKFVYITREAICWAEETNQQK